MNNKHIQGAQFRTAADYVDEQGQHNANVLSPAHVKNADRTIRLTCWALLVWSALGTFVELSPAWLLVDLGYAILFTAGLVFVLATVRFARRVM